MTKFTRHRLSRLGTTAVIAVLATVAMACTSTEDKGAGSPNGPAKSSTSVSTPTSDLVLSSDGKVVATVDKRFQSYNIEMVEVTGGQFWKPYGAGTGKVVREPIDLSSVRLRNLAKGLGPSYIRVSGSWANSTYFDPDGTAGETAPEGFGGVLTGAQWSGVGDFARAIDGEVLTSFASIDAARDSAGSWKSDQARSLLEYSKAHKVPLAAVELFNEPGLPVGMPAGYSAEAYKRDVGTLITLVDEVMPDLKIVGPGATSDVVPMVINVAVDGEGLADGAKQRLDAFSYHFYPKVSARCGSKEGPEIALTADYLSRITKTKAYYEDLRDRTAPGVPMWITETAQAACGGDQWASTYRDVPRYVDTLGRLSTGDGDVMFHNTLAASDYGLIDEANLEPRPSYWAGAVWAHLMGPKVPTVENATSVKDMTVYARCSSRGSDNGGGDDVDGVSGRVTYAVVNASMDQSRTVTTTSGKASVYLLTGDSLDGKSIRLNGKELKAADDGTLPVFKAKKVDGAVVVPPASVAFVVDAESPGCS